jgi:cytochrome P450
VKAEKNGETDLTFTEEDIIGSLTGQQFAAIDTSAYTSSSGLLYLTVKHPEYSQKIKDGGNGSWQEVFQNDMLD